jgi:hypothetical protein
MWLFVLSRRPWFGRRIQGSYYHKSIQNENLILGDIGQFHFSGISLPRSARQSHAKEREIDCPFYG